ncbi:MAG: hypothetical protein ABL866_11750 [Devosia sp.]
MTSKAALFALLTLWGVGAAPCLPAMAEETVTEAADDDAEAMDPLTDKVWVRSEDGQLPGTLKIFLSDGTLVQDSCWETHRLSPWQMVSSKALKWDEDGVEIAADIVSLSAEELVLSLKLKGGATEEQRYAPAPVPYLCPDMPKG